MTPAREKYLRNCPMYERGLRNELKQQAGNIKRCKADISYRLNIIKDNPEIAKYKTYMELLQMAKKMLQMHKALFTAVRRLLPKRKPAKKKAPVKNAGYWKVKPIKALVPGYIMCECSICGTEYASFEKQIEECFDVCPGCHRPMSRKGVMQ